MKTSRFMAALFLAVGLFAGAASDAQRIVVRSRPHYRRVYVAPRPSVVVVPAPVVITRPRPVYVVPAPVVVARPRRVYTAPRPVVVVRHPRRRVVFQ